MQKFNLDIFDSFEKWNENKNRTIFKNEKQLKNYQNYNLKKLLDNKNFYEPRFMMSSGTTNNKPKKYKFPKVLYPIIENHHIWKIMHFNGIQKGNVIKIFQGTGTNSTNCFLGPKKNPSLGMENDSWELIYNPLEVDSKFWEKTFEFVKDIKPRFLYTSPSVFECFYEQINFTFEFPVIFSCEKLTDAVKNKANVIFSRSIDKMRDWTTGFGFFECGLGTKHVYDDLCFAEQLNENMIKCVDFFNYCEPNPVKVSDDRGIIKRKLCDCGLYGNVIESFEGKFFEHLISMTGRKYAANYISNMLSSLSFDLLSYEIVQDKNKNITFKTEKGLDDTQALQIGKLFKRIIMDDGKNLNLYNNNKTIWESKNSNVCLNFKKNKFKIYNNKKISLRNFVV